MRRAHSSGDVAKAGFCQAGGRTQCANASRAAQAFAVRTARFGNSPFRQCRDGRGAPRLTVLAEAYRKPVFAGGAGGGNGGAFAAGADSLPFSRPASTLSRPLSGG